MRTPRPIRRARFSLNLPLVASGRGDKRRAHILINNMDVWKVAVQGYRSIYGPTVACHDDGAEGLNRARVLPEGNTTPVCGECLTTLSDMLGGRLIKAST